ncbi:MAG TPA: transglutaminase domain-containing protein [Flavisolibacter sp.]|jgi:hypothetical protein|nr:transglutaminase domain-containing protein [Flavisolibacter sp.]
MKWCVGILFCLWSFGASAQRPAANFAAIDWQVQSVSSNTPDSLAIKLTAGYTTELEKVRAIFTWICQNIAYNSNIYKPLYRRPPFIQGPVDTVSEWKSADEMVAQKVLSRRLAVCDGYSRLFKVLCTYAGIQAEVVNGYVRSNYERSAERFRTNHTWNAVRIDSTWHLVDVTWAAGYMTYNDEFVPKQNDFYFLTRPQDFVRDHFPEDLRWTLLAEPPTLAEFRKMPFKVKSYIKYGIESYSPRQGLVEAQVGDTLLFSLSLKDVKRAKNTISDPFLDTATFALSPLSVFIKPEKETGGEVFYSYVVDASTQWVHLLFNDDVVLRYSIQRRRPDLASN